MNTNDQKNKNQRSNNRRTDQGKRNEGGYALVGLMAVMMFALILTTAAAPTLRQEMQREKEEEMLWRGQQVASAIKNYRAARNQFPTDLDELVKGIDVGGKKIHFLRPSALCDPMMPCTGENNWRLVYPGDPLPKELLEAIISTQEKRQLPINPQNLQELAKFAQLGATQLPGQPSDGQLDGVSGAADNQGGDSGFGFGDKLKKGPIIGVVSKRSDKMFRSYYGIEEYDHALFFPNVPVIAGGFITPAVMAAVVAAGGSKDPRCPNGGLYVDGRCFGNVILGPMKRDPSARSDGGNPQQP